MSLFQVVVLAIVQGITEFLPVSSSAHLALAPWLLGWPDQGLTFDIALHLGTLLAVLLYFFRDWIQITANGFGLNYGNEELRSNRRLLWLLAAGSMPIAILGLLFQKKAETAWRDNHLLIGGMLIGVGILMWLADRAAPLGRGIGNIRLGDALAVGAAQSVAIIPGTSRSGITITAGLFRGLTRESAARFSFLLATPAIAGAGLKAGYDLYKQGGIPGDMRMPFVMGVLLSAAVGCGVIAWFLKYVQRRSMTLFVCYRVIFGIIVIALALSRRPAG